MAMAAVGGYDGTVTISDQNPYDEVFGGGDASADYSLNTTKAVFSTGESPGDWLDSGGNVGAFEVRVTMIYGTFTSGPAAGTWWPLSSNRSWNVFRTGLGGKSCSMTVEIRLAATGVVQDTATVSMTALVSP